MKAGARSERVTAALSRIAAGETAYAVAKSTGVSLRHLYRLLAVNRRPVRAETELA